MRTVTKTLATACALSAALLVAGCGGDGGKDTKSSGEVFLQPVAAQGPDPFTESTATSTPAPPPVTRTQQPTGASRGVRSISGGTPGLYGGTERVGSCDVNQQIDRLTSDRAKARAFAEAEGIAAASIPSYLRGLAPVVLRADTRVTNHGFRGGRANGFQSVLQAGTAVLVDNRGTPRVRCACGNPLRPAVAQHGGHGTAGRAWSGYRPSEVIVVTPAPQVITNITIIDIVNNTWIERPMGHGVHQDHVVPPPLPVTPTPTRTPTPTPTLTPSDTSTGPSSSNPSSSSPASSSPSGSPTDCVTPTVTVTPGATDDVQTGEPVVGPTVCPTATVTATPPTGPPTPRTPGLTATTVPGQPQSPSDSDEIGPETVPDTPDLPDGGGLIPDDTGSIFDSPTDVFDG
ncbi:DUF6777 domain-containing protein [Streptomyces cylindrosporus]|uniref:DUF6777 domain-containing protein n=1 Tax=Streptomyces cylindrosporus TaxID=2927583 RepID=A0ABS9YL72_9ACTN|nr:DUF6777 domain-containing protein [Streptomyces cylindrosporus]MCI3278023.1 hypothetical protein [Streptomyces cylindrosporus]